MMITTYSYLDGPYLETPYLLTGAGYSYPAQSKMQIIRSISTGTQINLRIDSGSLATRKQINLKISEVLHLVKTEVLAAPLNITNCYFYLEDPYLVYPYLGHRLCARLKTHIDIHIDSGLSTTRTQANLRIEENFYLVNTQSNLRIYDTENVGTQTDRRIDTGFYAVKSQIDQRIDTGSYSVKSQIDQRIDTGSLTFRNQINLTIPFLLSTQVIRALYNITRLRIMPTFPSRGISGTNWTQVIGGTAAGDFSLNNLNSDIVEQVWRSTAKSATIQNDVEISQGIFLDTLAILGHNFTTSATVQLQGSNSPIFATTPFSQNLVTELNNMYFISPTIPSVSFRYWRFVINDQTNAFGYLQIGTIIFGSSIIFNNECIVDQVKKRKVHFSDKVRTQGFTNVSNDRALKNAVTFSFKYLNYNLENYSNLSEVIDLVRTSLKALWIPDPRFTSRFAIFGKLSEIPIESHLVLGADSDYVDMELTIDESL
jgi:hypothetical protein